MIRFDVRTDFRDALRGLRDLDRKVQDRVVSRALNAVAEKTKTEARIQIHKEYNLASSDIGSMLSVVKARSQLRQLSVKITARSKRGRSLNLIRFVEKRVTLAEARRRRRSDTLDRLRVKIKRASGYKMLGKPDWAAGLPFIMTNRRTGGTFVGARETGNKVRGVYTIDVPQMFNSKRINALLWAKIQREFPDELKRAFDASGRGF
jgi:hypothetical protein